MMSFIRFIASGVRLIFLGTGLIILAATFVIGLASVRRLLSQTTSNQKSKPQDPDILEVEAKEVDPNN